MFIEFRLPSGAGGMAAGMFLGAIKRAVKQWSEKYNIAFTDKTVRYTYRVCFEHDKYYSFFATTFVPPSDQAHWQYKIIKDRNHPE